MVASFYILACASSSRNMCVTRHVIIQSWWKLVQNDAIESYQTGKLVFNLPDSKNSGYALVLLSGKLLY